MTLLNTPEQINAYRLLALKSRLKMEIVGLKGRGPSAATMIKKEFGLKGNNKKILEQFEKILVDNGILQK